MVAKMLTDHSYDKSNGSSKGKKGKAQVEVVEERRKAAIFDQIQLLQNPGTDCSRDSLVIVPTCRLVSSGLHVQVILTGLRSS